MSTPGTWWSGRRVAALILVGGLLLGACSGDDATSGTSTTATTAVVTDETTRTTVFIPPTFDAEDAVRELDVLAQAACLGISLDRTTPEGAAATLYNTVTNYQDEGATSEDLDALDLMVTGSLVHHCGPALAAEIDKVRFAIDD